MIPLGPLTLSLLVIICLTGCKVSAEEGDELKAVVVLYRHGDRSPMSSWPNDIYYGNTSLWPDGYGQLNNMGKERHYELGQWFRKRYDDFLPTRYNSGDIYVKSTDKDRALMSAAFNLAGLYPPEGDQVWSLNISWQGIPIHTVPESQDSILTAEIPCPKFDKLYAEFMNSEDIQAINRNLSTVYQNLSTLTGYTLDQLNLESFSGLLSTITIYKGLNFTLPQWTEDYWDLFKFWGAKKYQYATSTSELARLRTGPFFDYLMTYFDSVVAQNGTQKFLMLSAHDNTIADRMNALGVYPDAAPEFASTVIWEVRGGSKGFYVNMFFKNSTNFEQMVLPECQFDCALEEFAQIVTPLRVGVDEWREECYND